ncbi:MAG: rubredoxin [Negativicutes bacterium]|nr:rubredoxin [Negativicutes bacterium]
MEWMCQVCGYVYEPDDGEPPETNFEDLPADWCCPICGVAKDQFCSEC